MNHLINITKSDGARELFEEEKLRNSLKRVGASSDAIEDVIDEVESEMQENMTTSEIYSRAFALLRKHSLPIAVKYSIRRAMFELGPDGFPFEKFISRVFQLWGYDAVTDQTVLGHCVDHEVDVVAWKSDTLAMVEAKFHNSVGMKSDLKVSLYVKARYDDLADTTFDFGGVKRKLTERWLITNTKFTDKAIHYGECNHLKLLAWNYPAKGNLHEIVEQNGLHPITCINSLKRDEKREIVALGVLTCIDLVGNPNVLTKIGLKTDMIENVLTEAQMIIEQAK